MRHQGPPVRITYAFGEYGSGLRSTQRPHHGAPQVTAAQAAANRQELKKTLLSALAQHMVNAQPTIKALKEKEKQRVGVTPLLGACKGAKQVVDATYAAWASPGASALTPAQSQVRETFEFKASGPDQNIFDAADPDALKKFNVNISPEFRVKKLLQESHEGSRMAIGARNTEVIGPYFTPASYVGFESAANKLHDALVAQNGEQAADNAMKAAFFQGHAELIGPGPTGGRGPVGQRDQVTIPSGFASWADLIAASGSTAAAVQAANPALSTAMTPVAGQVIIIPGARDHIVVVAHEEESSATAAETKEQIARMHGVTTTQLERANPAVTASGGWTSLGEGQRILIPKH